MLKKLKARLRQDVFLTTALDIATSPIYIIRSGLYKNISSMASRLKGDILDFGCGSKPYESLFVNAASYVGVDIEISGHNHQSSEVDCFYDGKTLPFPTGYFDAVVCFEVLEHVFNIDEVLAEIKRVLKPNGQVLVTIPFAWDEHEAPYDFARYTSYGIKHIFEKNEFDVIEIRKSTTYVLAACQMFIAYLAQHVSPKEGIPRRLFQLFLIFPLNSLALGLDAVLPKRYEYFCNSIVLARKPS